METMPTPVALNFHGLALDSTTPAQGPKGFHVNLLANSLTSKLKLLRAADHQEKQTRQSPCVAHDNPRFSLKSILLNQERGEVEDGPHRELSSHVRKRNEIPDGDDNVRYRVRSASSNKSTPVSPSSIKSPTNSKRSNSAEHTRGRPCSNATGRVQSGAMTSSRSRGSAIGGSAFSFQSRGADSTVKVVKRDGVFKPIDKYAPGRQLLREFGNQQHNAMCDYELYVLPLGSEEGAISEVHTRGHMDSSSNKRQPKVSWFVLHEDDDEKQDRAETDMVLEGHFVTASSTPNRIHRTRSTDSMGFKRPKYVTGSSQIRTIGLNWSFPSSEKAPPEVIKEERPVKEIVRKPMWSYLITGEKRAQSCPAEDGKVRPAGTSINPLSPRSGPSSKSGQSFNSGPSSKGGVPGDVRAGHSRNVHPVSTAMDREGTSISKTKWKVPSSTTSTLDAERAVMSRLQLVKRPGNRMLFEPPGRSTSNAAALKFREALLLEQEHQMKSKINNYYKEDFGKHDTSIEENAGTSYSSPRREYNSSSPTKTRSSLN